jgi:uncharacterized membrane protein YuzA (DUF378 family)
MLKPLLPFLGLLIVAIIFGYIPMEQTMKKIGYLIIGVVAVYLLLKLAGLL